MEWLKEFGGPEFDCLWPPGATEPHFIRNYKAEHIDPDSYILKYDEPTRSFMLAVNTYSILVMNDRIRKATEQKLNGNHKFTSTLTNNMIKVMALQGKVSLDWAEKELERRRK